MANRKIGYIRVSSADQNFARQEESMKDCDIIFKEKVSGVKADRVELKKALEYLREGDTFVFHDLSRLSRKATETLQIIEDLHARKIRIVMAQTEMVIDDTPMGRMTIMIFGAVAQYHRDVIKEAQAEGLAVAKERWRKDPTLPRPGKRRDEKKYNYAKSLFEKKLNGELKLSNEDICKLVGCKIAILYRWAAEWKADIEAENKQKLKDELRKEILEEQKERSI